MPPVLRPSDFELGPPELPIGIVADLVRHEYGLDGRPRRLNGERDLNLLFGDGDAARLVKVSGVDERDDVLDLQIEALLHLERHSPDLPVPRVVRTVDGATSARLEAPSGAVHAVRALTFVPGEPFAGSGELDTGSLESIGRVVGALARALGSFEHAGADHFLLWDISNGVVGAEEVWAVAGRDLVDLAGAHRERLAGEVLPMLGRQRAQIIHSDAHAGNVLRRRGTSQVAGIIDFGDIVRAPLVNDLAISASGFLRNDLLGPIHAVAALARGYDAAYPLVDDEVGLLYDAVLARLVLTLLLFDYQIVNRTGHASYCAASRSGAFRELRSWLEHDRAAATERFLEGMGR